MSLKCMIDKWLHKGQISQEEYDAVMKKLEGHDKQVRENALDEYYLKLLNCKTNKVKSIHDAEIWVEFKRQSTKILEQLKVR